MMATAGIQYVAPDWRTARQVSAAVTLRTGGVSAAPFDSLNLGAPDDDAAGAVAENQRRISEHFGLPSEPVWLHQTHGAVVVDLDAADLGTPPHADAAVTRRAGPVCAVRIADCMPVLLTEKDGAVIGAAHAGWRGLAGGVIEATVKTMGAEASRVLAWLGPAIGPASFEVGDDVRAAFLDKDAAADGAFTRNARGRWQCDLYMLARQRLAAIGVTHVTGGSWDTCAEPERFFSYRRDGRCGRMAALIWINP
jgi:purine-nucleoside/S-methyl-5'-thioadenosine phosphorylase / adenosine deaminase